MAATAPRRDDTDADGEAYLRGAQALGPRLDAAAVEIERRRELPDDIVAALIETGLYRLLLPRSLGGAELGPPSYVPIIEEIATHDASAAWCLGQACGCSMSAAYLDPEAAREIFGPPTGIVAWGPPGPAQARAVPGGFLLSGEWSFASGSHHASWLGAHVAVAAEDGTPQQRPDGTGVLRTMLFPKAEAAMTDIWHVIGLKGTGSDRYSVCDLFVPERYTILRDEHAAPREPGRLYRFSSSNLYASAFAGVALGIARSTLDAFLSLARDKIPRGAKRTMRDNNVVQALTGQAEARLASARAFLLRSLGEIWDAVGRCGALTLADNATIRLASTWAIHQSRDVVAELYHAAGATAIFSGQPFERRFRDIHTVAQQMQGRQTHFETVGRILLGLEPDATMFTF